MYVYIFRTAPHTYKIGHSLDWRRRLSTFRTGNHEIEPVLVWEAPDSKLESRLHLLYRQDRIKNEIFGIRWWDWPEMTRLAGEAGVVYMAEWFKREVAAPPARVLESVMPWTLV